MKKRVKKSFTRISRIHAETYLTAERKDGDGRDFTEANEGNEGEARIFTTDDTDGHGFGGKRPGLQRDEPAIPAKEREERIEE